MYIVQKCLYDPIDRNILYSILSQEEIFKYYTQSDVIPDGRPVVARYRHDNKPSLSFKYDNNILIGADWGTGFRGDCIMFVRELYKINYFEAIKKILNDFNITEYDRNNTLVSSVGNNSFSINSSKKSITTKRKEFTTRELGYWAQYGITEQTLISYHIYSLSHVFIDNKVVTTNTGQLLFGYYCGNGYWRIYQPENSEYRWFGTLPVGTVFGWKQLTLSNPLFITSSLKDVCTLRELNYNAVAPVNELAFMDEGRFNRLKATYKDIILFFNNDNPGIDSAIKYSKQYNIPYIHLPINAPKDPSDFVKQYNKEDLDNEITRLCMNIK